MKFGLTFGLLMVLVGGSNAGVTGHEVPTGQHHGAAKAEGQADAFGDQLGTVEFPLTCKKEAGRPFERGLALLHHMTYEGARKEFAAVIESDPNCVMGYWGQAMTYIHPLWHDPPTEENFERGLRLLEEAENRGQKSDRERAYIAAVKAYYKPGWSHDETANLTAFEASWEKTHKQFPKDPEAALFYALAHLAIADPGDKTYQKQKRAGSLAEEVLSQIPGHPGAHHYIIHAYDYPPLAEKALDVARSYGEIAPDVPHALHMPTHIFTRLGLWPESIAWNKRSAAAALKHPAGDKVSLHYLHALDYLAYAYLQRAEDEKAREVLEKMRSLEGPLQVQLGSAYTAAAVPARFVLERQKWAEASRLEARVPSDFPWEQFPAMEAITHFARAVGVARSGDEELALQELDRLTQLRQEAAKMSAYWAQQVEIQEESARAWLQFQRGDREKALETMQRAAELEASTEKHPVTPGEVLPARELLADMLLEMGRYAEAREGYEAALVRSPNRFNSLYGAARAAELAGDKNTASLYFTNLMEMTADSETDRPRLDHAKAFLAKNQNSGDR